MAHKKEDSKLNRMAKFGILVRITGLEPASLTTHEPESCVFANFTISASIIMWQKPMIE